jgi:preprotein translocase subunit SecE
MATKAALAKGEDGLGPVKTSPVKPTPVKSAAKRQEPNAALTAVDKTMGVWKEFTQFLSDVRGEMRKVVTPSRKEVEATTTVVIVAVFIFGLFFFIVDWIFGLGLNSLLSKLGGVQQ